MKDIKRFLNRVKRWIIVFTVLLFSFIYFMPGALAVSAERGNFVILGRAVKNEAGDSVLIDEVVDLYYQLDPLDIVYAKVKSGTVVSVLDKAELETGNFYFVSTVGRDGGLMGWVKEDYIYEITAEPPRE